MKLVWTNCVVYNGKLSPIGKMGDRLEGAFEQLWAGAAVFGLLTCFLLLRPS